MFVTTHEIAKSFERLVRLALDGPHRYAEYLRRLCLGHVLEKTERDARALTVRQPCDGAYGIEALGDIDFDGVVKPAHAVPHLQRFATEERSREIHDRRAQVCVSGGVVPQALPCPPQPHEPFLSD